MESFSSSCLKWCEGILRLNISCQSQGAYFQALLVLSAMRTFQDRSLGTWRMGWQFYRAMLLTLKINTGDNFEDYFYHVNQMLTVRTQVQTFVGKTWLAHLKGHHLTWLFREQFLIDSIKTLSCLDSPYNLDAKSLLLLLNALPCIPPGLQG